MFVLLGCVNLHVEGRGQPECLSSEAIHLVPRDSVGANLLHLG